MATGTSRRRFLQHATAFGAARGALYGSGFGLPPDEGFLRIVFLASPDELRDIYKMMAAFTEKYLGDTRS